MALSPPPMSWVAIIAILVAVAVGTGLLVGLLGTLMPLPRWLPTTALGASVGAVAALLIGRRRAQLAEPPSR